MRKIALFIAAIAIIGSSCNQSETNQSTENATMSTNPLLEVFNTPHGVPPFDKIKPEHFLPAVKEAIDVHNKEIQAIIENTETPTFENVVVAYDNSGELLDRVEFIFENLNSAMTSDTLQKLSEEIAPLTAAHKDEVNLNADLFAKFKAIHEQKDQLNLSTEQLFTLDKIYKKFVRGGANLPEEKKARFKEINEELALLDLKFGSNVLAETNAFQLVIDKEEDLAGLPESVVQGAAEAAAENNLTGKWLFTLHKPSLIPFLQYSSKRELREKIFTANINRGNNNNEFDNKKIATRIAELRSEKAGLLGFDTHAHFVLDNNMSKTPENVYNLLNKVWDAALPAAKKEAEELQKMIDSEGGGFKLASWDWWYYAEKLRKQKYDLDEEATRPYFKLDNVISGVFNVSQKLFGLTFSPISDIPTYHPEATAYEVKNAKNEFVGVLYMDFFPRASKRGGAWMTAFQKQSKRSGIEHYPIISVVCNFSKPTGDKPSLLSYDEVLTLFHEFGHALHGLLSDCTYYTISGTSVTRDFVELPSQIMENWASEPEVLKQYALHFETGDTIPDELIQKIMNSSSFNQGFAATEYLAASFLDLAWHTLKDTSIADALSFEKSVLDKIGLIDEIVVRYRSTYFNHIFGGGYSSGYYSYIWAEVLDADAFEAFKEKGIFNAELAASFKDNILSKGASDDPMVMYKMFRGREPEVKALLARRGLN